MGRPKGAINKSKGQAKLRAIEILESEDYKTSLMARIKARTLPPNVETMLWYYAYGRPVERLIVEDQRAGEDLADKSSAELAQRALEVAAQLKQLEQVEQLAQAADQPKDGEKQVH